MSEIEFGDPNLREVRLVRKYELDGVAFIKDIEEPIGFTFYSQNIGLLDLTMEVLGGKELYAFFKKLFKEPLAPMKKDSLTSRLNVYWRLKSENKEVILQKVEETMNVEWRKVFDTIFSAHEKKE